MVAHYLLFMSAISSRLLWASSQSGGGRDIKDKSQNLVGLEHPHHWLKKKKKSHNTSPDSKGEEIDSCQEEMQRIVTILKSITS